MQSTKDSFLEIVNALGGSKELYLNEINAIINELNIVQDLRETLVRNESKKSEKEEILGEPFKCFLYDNKVPIRFQTALIKQLRYERDIITLRRYKDNYMTVRDFLSVYDIEKIHEIRHVGEKTINALTEALEKFDLHIQGSERR